ncbi:MAG: hypothetical protein WCI41_04150 [bacterium]
MLGENKNLKDPTQKPSALYGAGSDNNVSVKLTYTKTNKLITALFMVTDIMDREEPLRNKLRILGTNIISDMHSNPSDSSKKISEILSFLDISFAIGMISEMNSSILKKEFIELQHSVKEFISKKNPMWLEEFMREVPALPENLSEQTREEPVDYFKNTNIVNKSHVNNSRSIGHIGQTRIGVQKGGNLMKVLSDKVSSMSPGVKHVHLANPVSHPTNQSYEILKNKRREEIVSIIKNKLSVFPESGGATITDIKNSAEGPLVSCGEKTLQRELVSMVHDGVLKKIGEKRWSKYFI